MEDRQVGLVHVLQHALRMQAMQLMATGLTQRSCKKAVWQLLNFAYLARKTICSKDALKPQDLKAYSLGAAWPHWMTTKEALQWPLTICPALSLFHVQTDCAAHCTS